ncbi:alpha/beta hydrolase [Streptomyces sp. B6B3]|uniref:alpha/beta fold hydrolase n=1 Tax=Streptomyces sp. B6B3 TaxID=3153570 RepID=UPI00325D15B6
MTVTHPRGTGAREVGTLPVPGATLHYEVRGAGPPLLLIPGGNSDAAVFEDLAAVLVADHRVVCYDPRGQSRSPLQGPPDQQRVEVHADDAGRLLRHVAADGEPARVLGSCAGGLVALELAARRPELVRAMVAHEPPALSLLPAAEGHRVLLDEIHATFRREGVAPAMEALSDALFGGRPAPELPTAGDNSAFFLGHVVRSFSGFVPDLDALAGLAASGSRVTVAAGRESVGQDVRRPAVLLAERLGLELALFPGGHVGYVNDPAGFARRLGEVFRAGPGRAGGG